MRKRVQRWYQKNEYLNAFMNLMQDLSPENQCEIAVDIIITASNMIERDYSNIIKEIATFNPKDYKRWYDKNPNIHLAIESLRDLTDEQRDVIIQEFTDKILSSHKIKIEGIDEL